VRLALVLVALAALATAPGALALDCPNVPLEERLEAADVAFVGRVTDERPGPGDGGVVYRFVVDQSVKGSVGREVEVDAATRLVDAADEPLVHDEALGVLARGEGGADRHGVLPAHGSGGVALDERRAEGRRDQDRDRARDPRRRARVLGPPPAETRAPATK
jgi:hypothetical protein